MRDSRADREDVREYRYGARRTLRPNAAQNSQPADVKMIHKLWTTNALLGCEVVGKVEEEDKEEEEDSDSVSSFKPPRFQLFSFI